MQDIKKHLNSIEIKTRFRAHLLTDASGYFCPKCNPRKIQLIMVANFAILKGIVMDIGKLFSGASFFRRVRAIIIVAFCLSSGASSLRCVWENLFSLAIIPLFGLSFGGIRISGKQLQPCQFGDSTQKLKRFFLPLMKIQINMSTLNIILREMKDVPVNRLEELYQFIHSMTPKTKHSDSLRKKILSFGGAFSDMSSDDYNDFLNQTKKTRTELFDRKFEI